MNEKEIWYNEAKELYEKCKKLLWERCGICNTDLLILAETKEEQAFYQTVNDFFLQQEQKKFIQLKQF